MRRILVCTGVFGGGTALVFALAAATAILFPQGTLVSTGWNNGMVFAKPMPMPMPGQRGGDIFVDDVIALPMVEAPQAVPGMVP